MEEFSSAGRATCLEKQVCVCVCVCVNIGGLYDWDTWNSFSRDKESCSPQYILVNRNESFQIIYKGSTCANKDLEQSIFKL